MKIPVSPEYGPTVPSGEETLSSVLHDVVPTAIVFLACQKVILRGIVLPSMK